jgi:hypothetical protein
MRKRYVEEPPTVAKPAAPIVNPLPLQRAVGAIIGVALIATAFLGIAAFSVRNVEGDLCAKSQKNDIVLTGPFEPDGAFGYIAPEIPGTRSRSDDMHNSRRSTAVVCEDKKIIGTAHSLHADIRTKGRGRYSHWRGSLYFSTSDNTNPNTNGRRYKIHIP